MFKLVHIPTAKLVASWDHSPPAGKLFETEKQAINYVKDNAVLFSDRGGFLWLTSSKPYYIEFYTIYTPEQFVCVSDDEVKH